MNEKDPVKLNRYYVLRLLSVVYKILAILVVVFAVVAAAYVWADYLSTDIRSRPAVSQPAGQMVADLLVGGIVALSFYVLARIIDVQLYQLSIKMS